MSQTMFNTREPLLSMDLQALGANTNDAGAVLPDWLEKYRAQAQEPVKPTKPVEPNMTGYSGIFNQRSGAYDDYLKASAAYVEAAKRYPKDMAAHERFLNFEEALASQYYEHDLQAEFDQMPQETKDKLAVAYSATSAISEVAQDAIEDVRAWRDRYIANLSRGPMGGIDGLL